MPFVAVHVGAGYHGIGLREEYKKICSEACEQAMKCLKEKCSAIEGLTKAITILEDNGLTNAGFGSNLNSNGFVECDASLMNGSDLRWGAVGALTGIKNPIIAAEYVIKEQNKSLPLGLIAPNVLVGEGARVWATNHGCIAANLITEKSKENYKKYKRRLDAVVREEENEIIIKQSRLDTVGGVCVDWDGNVAGGVSSGGLALKQMGRIGQASMMGCGCWAQNGVAVSTTGIGEYLIKTLFAKQCAEELLKNINGNPINGLNHAFEKKFFNSPFLQNIPKDDRLAGVLAIVHDKDNSHTDLIWAHSTPSMCIGYMNSSNHSSKAIVSQMSVQTKPGHSFKVEAKAFRH